MSVHKIITATLTGINAVLVEVEANISNGLPATVIVGLPDTSVQESRERIRSAIKCSGFAYPQTRVSLNLAPSGLPKMGTNFDVPIAIAVMLADGLKTPLSSDYFKKQLFVGELSFDGSIKSAPGILAMVQTVKNAGFESVFIPQANASMAALVKGITIYPLENLKQALDHISGKVQIKSYDGRFSTPNKPVSSSFENDFQEIFGQRHAKRALEIVAAGGHNILMTGPPGSGKTMLAKSLVRILPQLQLDEILDLTKIYNSSGFLNVGVISQRPMRSPHHTTSSIALIGGGGVPRPGEVTLAHHGILFLDELPEFSRSVLEVLRQPLEENEITITRARHSYTFPANFILVAAQNPCPCGNFGQQDLECLCHPVSIQRYRKKISGPLLDRIDLHVDVRRLPYREVQFSNEDLISNNVNMESSALVQERVVKARKIQNTRFMKSQTNSTMTVAQLKQFCQIDETSNKMLEIAAEKYLLSARSIHRVLKVARTIADLAGSENILTEHLAESLQYRLREDPAP